MPAPSAKMKSAECRRRDKRSRPDIANSSTVSHGRAEGRWIQRVLDVLHARLREASRQWACSPAGDTLATHSVLITDYGLACDERISLMHGGFSIRSNVEAERNLRIHGSAHPCWRLRVAVTRHLFGMTGGIRQSARPPMARTALIERTCDNKRAAGACVRKEYRRRYVYQPRRLYRKTACRRSHQSAFGNGMAVVFTIAVWSFN